MDITITEVTFIPEKGAPVSFVSKTSFEHYDGSPLFCHITRHEGGGSVDVLFDQTPPDEFPKEGKGGPIGSVTVKFAKNYSTQAKAMTWHTKGPGGVYSGGPTNPYLEFESAHLKTARLVLPDALPEAKRRTEIPTFAVFYLGPELTYGNPRAYFINVPLLAVPHDNTSQKRLERDNGPHGPERKHYQAHTSGRIVWGPQSGSMAGPIGQVNLP